MRRYQRVAQMPSLKLLQLMRNLRCSHLSCPDRIFNRYMLGVRMSHLSFIRLLNNCEMGIYERWRRRGLIRGRVEGTAVHGARDTVEGQLLTAEVEGDIRTYRASHIGVIAVQSSLSQKFGMYLRAQQDRWWYRARTQHWASTIWNWYNHQYKVANNVIIRY